MESTETTILSSRLREKLRAYSKLGRESRRNCENDSFRFGLGEIQSKISDLDNLNEKDVSGLCCRIKRRKHASSDDMFRLSHAFLQKPENITTFAKIPGALNVLVKELTGHDSESQIRACETICNLSLGDSVVCEKIALAAGSYLVTYLDSTDQRLKRTSLWVVANLAKSGGKGLQILISQKIISKLIALYNEEANEDNLFDVITALELVISPKSDSLRQADKEIIIQKMFTKPSNSLLAEHHLKLIFIADVLCPDNKLDEEKLLYLIEFCLYNIINAEDFLTNTNILRVLFAVRVLSNVLATSSLGLSLLLKSCNKIELTLSDVLNKLFSFDSKILMEECFWLIKNIFDNHSKCPDTGLDFNLLLESLRIKRFTFMGSF